MNHTVKIIPPCGWKYGFPKDYNGSPDIKTIKEWLLVNGYPQEEIDSRPENFPIVISDPDTGATNLIVS
jgi:hypothetical protein